jgi:ParB-like chromosome segregation protein Spo0J
MIIPICLIKSEWPPTLTHGDPRFDKILESVRKEGIKEPLIINLQWYIMDGNHRLAVAKFLGIERVTVRVWTGTELIG